jgi:hypothetical protein
MHQLQNPSLEWREFGDITLDAGGNQFPPHHELDQGQHTQGDAQQDEQATDAVIVFTLASPVFSCAMHHSPRLI